MTFQRLMGSCRRDRSAAEWNHRSTTVDCDKTDVYSVRTAVDLLRMRSHPSDGVGIS